MPWLLLLLVPIAAAVTAWRWRVRRAARSMWLVEALAEQARREAEHPVDYRPDQRELAIAQRLSRRAGPRAFSEKSKLEIQQAIHSHPVLGPWHRE